MPTRENQIRTSLEARLGSPDSRHLAWRWATVYELPFTPTALRFATHFPEFPYQTERFDTSRGLWELVRSWLGARTYGGDCDDQATMTVAAIHAVRPDLEPNLEFLPRDYPTHVRAAYRSGRDRQSLDHTPYFPMAAR